MSEELRESLRHSLALGVAAERCGQGRELRHIPGYTGLHQAQAATPQCWGRPARWGEIARGTENQGGADDGENSCDPESWWLCEV